MSSSHQKLSWGAITSTGIFLGGLAGILYNRVASPDYKQLVDFIKANDLLLYPNIPNTTVCTFRTKIYSQPQFSEHDPWTATLSRKADKLILKEVHGRRSREDALKALNRELKKTWKGSIEQVRLRGGHERGEEFEERNGRKQGDVGDEEGLCYGNWE